MRRETHELKTWPRQWAAVNEGHKKVDIRKADRDFQVGDILRLREYCPVREQYSGAECFREITHILHGGEFGLESGYVALSIVPPPPDRKLHT